MYLSHSQKEEYRIPTPPDFVYRIRWASGAQEDPTRNVFKEGEAQPLFTITKFEYPEEKDGGGIFIHYKELLYPRKGFPYPEAVYAVNLAKHQIISWLRFFSRKELVPSYLGFLLIPWSLKIRVLTRFLETYYNTVNLELNAHLLLDRYYMAPARELSKYVVLFLENLGIKQEVAKSIGHVVAMIIEYDTAYCWRIQDVFSEAKKEDLLNNPAKELTRLFNILQERDIMSEKVREHARAISNILRFALKIGKIKRAFIKATEEIDLSKIAFTEADKYHVSFLAGYNFMGKTYEERIEFIKSLHDGVVPTGPFKLNVH